MEQMSLGRFLFWSILGGAAYAVALLGVGYALGAAANILSPNFNRAGIFAIGLALAISLLWLLVVKLRQAAPFFVSVGCSVGRAIVENPEVRALVNRNAIFFSFVSRRLSREDFTGLPVTLLAAVFLYFLTLYLGSTLNYLAQGSVLAMDLRVANLLFAFRDPALIQVFTAITAFGNWESIVPLTLAIAALLIVTQRTGYLAGLLLTLIGNQLTVTALKVLFARPRPELAVYTESSFSFPSGHSAVSVALFGFLAYVLIRERVGSRIVTVLTLGTMILLIGMSRLYLVEHYLSDVLNGYLVGSLWVLSGMWLTEWVRSKKTANLPVLLSRRRKILSLGIVVVAAFGVGMVVEDFQQRVQIHSASGISDLGMTLEDAFASSRLPARSESILGQPQEPISVVVLAKGDADFLAAMTGSGWNIADRPGLRTMSRAAIAAWFGREYNTAPVTPAFWNGQPHDFGFEEETPDKSLRQRHHVRFWRTGYRDAEGMLIYVGTASFDNGLKWGLTHSIDPNIDAERDYLAGELQALGGAAFVRTLSVVAPILGQNMTGDLFFTDGNAVVLRVN